MVVFSNNNSQCFFSDVCMCVALDSHMHTIAFHLFIDGIGSVSLGDILQFVSGSNKLPAAGFSTTPSICFTDEECFPRASTCDVSITFPTSLALMTYEEFKDRLNTSVCGSFGFGQP